MRKNDGVENIIEKFSVRRGRIREKVSLESTKKKENRSGSNVLHYACRLTEFSATLFTTLWQEQLTVSG